MKKEQNGRKSLRRLKPTVGCNASKRRRRSVHMPLLYEGESIIIRTVCFIFRKTRAEILQLHNFSA